MAENTQLVQYFLPNLKAGEYEVSVTQTVKTGTTERQKVSKKMQFGVDAARFVLNTDDIYSVYPPANTSGQYSGHFPHIVFNRRTLPWERSINGKPDEETKSPTPWMVLLLFDEAEMRDIKIHTTAIKDLLYQEQPSDGVSRPKVWDKDTTDKVPRLMDWEDGEKECLSIDISKDLYQLYLPKQDELQLLAHSKIVSTVHKDTNGIGDAEGEMGYFSVLVGHRVIQKNKAYKAIVVSLEGHEEYINGKEEIKSKIRLAALANWNFYSDGTTSFETLLRDIEVKDMSAVHTVATGSKLEAYLQHGYVPLRHQMRNGVKNISWYRGPFVPHEVGFDNQKYIGFSNSDAALYYDTYTGMLDASIAAAWELGKIVALKNQEFTKAMIGWVNDPFVKKQSSTKSIPTKTALIQWIENKEKETSESLSEGEKSYKPFPTEVKSFLKALASLKGIPLAYLVPDLKYITKKDGNDGSLVVFRIHPKWIYALLDGATSLTGLRTLDTKTQLEGIIKDIYETSEWTGFLLHSALVSGWRGLEIKALDTQENTMTNPLRFERINDDLFLGIFKGVIHKLCIKQPYEGLHFGVKEIKEGYQKALKNAEGGFTKIEIAIDEASGILKANQVIDLRLFANEIKKHTGNGSISSMEYAYQMIDSRMESTIEIQFNKK